MPHKLLLADDSVTIQRVIELTFADEDIEVTTVGDGQLAIERLDADPPDIVLADVDMPKRDGYEVATYVKSHPKLAHIPVVLLTGAFEPIDSARAAAAGSSDVLAKPFEPQMVINRVKELLGKKRQDEVRLPTAAPRVATTYAPAAQLENPSGDNRAATAEVEQAVSLDDYFDQLDAAFSNLQPAAPTESEAQSEIDWSIVAEPEVAAEAAAPAPPRPSIVPPAMAGPTEQFEANHDNVSAPMWGELPAIEEPAAPAPAAATVSSPHPVDHPSEVLSQSTFVEPAWAAVEPAWAIPEPPAPPAPPVSAPVAAVELEPVHEVNTPAAVASVLAAPVLSSPGPRVVTANPFAALSAVKAEVAAARVPVVTEEMLEDIVSRVLQRMTDKIVRETVSDIVSQTAERMVQEEIDRIKNTEP